jgi:hypothetical protein
MKDIDVYATIACVLIVSPFFAVPFCLLARWHQLPLGYRQIMKLFVGILAAAAAILLGIYELGMQEYKIRIDALVVWPAAALHFSSVPICASSQRPVV